MTEKRDEWREQGKHVANAFVEGLGEIRDGVTEQTAKHEDTIKAKLGKAADYLDEKTKHKYSGKLDKVGGRLSDGVERVADQGRESARRRESTDARTEDADGESPTSS